METEQSSFLEEVFSDTDPPNSPVSAIDSLDNSKDGDPLNESNKGALDVREKYSSYERNLLNGKDKASLSPQDPVATKILEVSCDDELDFEDDFYEKEISKQSSDEHGVGNQQHERNSDSVEGEKVLDKELKPEKENGGNSKAEFEEGGRSEGELSNEDGDLEEGEVKDASPSPEQPAPMVCPYFNRGRCTWGYNCRFLHQRPGDKGNYNMFPPMRSSQLELGQHRGMGFRPHVGKPFRPPRYDVDLPAPEVSPFPFPEAPPEQSLDFHWERALKETKERIEKAKKRKEQGPNFEEEQTNRNYDASDSSSDKENEVSTESQYRRQSNVYNRYDEQKVKDNSYRFSRERERSEELKMRRGRQCVTNNRCEETPFTRKSFIDPFKANGHFRPEQRWRDERLSEMRTRRAGSSEWNDPWWRSKAVKPTRNRLRSKSSSSRSPSESGSSRKSTQRKVPTRPSPYKRRQRSCSSSSSRISCSKAVKPTRNRLRSKSSSSRSPSESGSSRKSTQRKVPSRPSPYKRRQRSCSSSSSSISCPSSSQSSSKSSRRHRSVSKSPIGSRSTYVSPSRSPPRPRSFSVSSIGSDEGCDANYKDKRGSREKRQGRRCEDRLEARKNDARKKTLNNELRPKTSRKPGRDNRQPEIRTIKTRVNKCSDTRRRSSNSASNSTSPSRSRSVSSASESGRSHSSSGSEHLHVQKTRASRKKSRNSELKWGKKGRSLEGASKGTKRPLSPSSERNNSAAKRPAVSRKEMLLKQLRAVEDEIARKKAEKD